MAQSKNTSPSSSPSTPSLADMPQGLSPSEQLAWVTRKLAEAQAALVAAQTRTGPNQVLRITESKNANGYTVLAIPGAAALALSPKHVAGLVDQGEKVLEMLKAYATPERMGKLAVQHAAHKASKAQAA